MNHVQHTLALCILGYSNLPITFVSLRVSRNGLADAATKAGMSRQRHPLFGCDHWVNGQNSRQWARSILNPVKKPVTSRLTIAQWRRRQQSIKAGSA